MQAAKETDDVPHVSKHEQDGAEYDVIPDDHPTHHRRDFISESTVRDTPGGSTVSVSADTLLHEITNIVICLVCHIRRFNTVCLLCWQVGK